MTQVAASGSAETHPTRARRDREGSGRTQEPIKTIVVDDHPLYRDGVIRTLNAEPDIRVVGEGANLADAENLIETHTPDVALLDLSMPGDGHCALSKINSTHPGVRLAVLTASENPQDLSRALRNGACGYVVKGVGGRELAKIVRSLAAGNSYVSPSLAAEAAFAHSKTLSAPLGEQFASLSKREVDILRLIAQGLTNNEVGGALDLQEKTVKQYMTAIMQKLDVRNRVEAAIKARNYWA